MTEITFKTDLNLRLSNDTDTCWRDCLAIILDLPFDEVIDVFLTDETTENWVKATTQWLKRKHKKTLICLENELISAVTPVGSCIYVGQSQNGVKHACIYEQGVLVYDPAKGQGIVPNTIEYIFIIK